MEKIKSLNSNKLFEELFCLILSIITVLFWKFSSLTGMIIILLVAAISLILFNDFKYMIPCSIYFIFSINYTFESDKIPIAVVICAFLLIGVLISFLIRNGFNFNERKSWKGIAILAALCPLPLLWNNIIDAGNEGFYFVYLAYFSYFIAYLFFSSSLNNKSYNFLITAISYIPLILCFECILGYFNYIHINSLEPSLDIAYAIGWGYCNEAGIMMCFSLPFVFIKLIKKESIFSLITSIIMIILFPIGIIMTTSRGAFLFGFFELFVMLVICFIMTNNKKVYGAILATLFVSFILLLQIIYGIDKLFDKIINEMFVRGFDSSERFVLWRSAFDSWKQSGLTIVFGSGMVSGYLPLAYTDGVLKYKVYHSTFHETLVMAGIIGIIALLYHLFEKYRQTFRLDKTSFWFILSGYIIVDLYGLIDNTYGMYYYMIPLVIIMATIDKNEFDSERKYNQIIQ